MEKPNFPEVIDNTFREALSQCQHLGYYKVLRRLESQVPNIHLHAGKAFARGMEMTRKAFYEQQLSVKESEEIGQAAMEESYGDFDLVNDYLDHSKSLSNLIRAFQDYWMQYPLNFETLHPVKIRDGRYAIECSFSIPMEINHPVTGNPILYAGKFDMLAERNGNIFVVDEKTTTQLGQSWAAQWDLASQFTGYCFGAREFGYEALGAVIRGVGILKTKISHQEVLLNRSQWIIERWWRQVHRDVQMLKALWEVDPGDGSQFGYALGSACSNYGGCSFKKLCETQFPESYIPVYYQISDWSPLQGHSD